jgi:hypothetical protein
MLRQLGVVAVVAAALSIDAGSAAAATRLSPNNPYRSFNISGVNYGSMRWERAHRGGSWRRPYMHRGGFFFRRR